MSTPCALLQSKASPVPITIQEVRRDSAPAPVILTDEQLTAATLAAASSIRAKLNTIWGHHTPAWFAEEAAAVIAAEIRKAEASAVRHANPFTVVTPAPGTPALTPNAA